MEQEKLNKLHQIEIEILDEIVRVCDKYNIEYCLVGGTLLGAVRHKGFIPWDDDLDIGMPRKDYENFLKVAKKELQEGYALDWYTTNKNYWLPFCKVRKKGTIYREQAQENYKGDCAIWVDIFPLDNSSKEVSKLQNLKYRISERIKGILSFKNGVVFEETKGTKKVLKQLFAFFPSVWYNTMWKQVLTFKNNDKNKYFVNIGSQYGLKKQTHLKDKYIPFCKIEFEGKKYKVPNDYDYVLTKIYGKKYMELPPIEKRVTHNPIEIKF